MLVQIYGITNAEDAAAVDRLGADHIGVVVDEGLATWDSVDETTAATIIASIARARVVGLSLSTDPDRIRQTTKAVRPSIVHLARAHLMSDDALAAVREMLSPIELMLTVPVVDDEALATARRLQPAADYLLLDSKDPGTGIVGATGLVHDWRLSAAIVATVEVPVILAGGLGPDNVTPAIDQVHPAGVDSETHTSRTDDRRRKDLDKVDAFISLATRGAP